MPPRFFNGYIYAVIKELSMGIVMVLSEEEGMECKIYVDGE